MLKVSNSPRSPRFGIVFDSRGGKDCRDRAIEYVERNNLPDGSIMPIFINNRFFGLGQTEYCAVDEPNGGAQDATTARDAFMTGDYATLVELSKKAQ